MEVSMISAVDADSRPIPQIPQCIRHIYHNISFWLCIRNVHTCAHLLHMVHCGIWDWCTVGFVQHIYTDMANMSMSTYIQQQALNWLCHIHGGFITTDVNLRLLFSSKTNLYTRKMFKRGIRRTHRKSNVIWLFFFLCVHRKLSKWHFGVQPMTNILWKKLWKWRFNCNGRFVIKFKIIHNR